MERVSDPHQGRPIQDETDDDLNLPEEEFDHQEGAMTQTDDDLMLSDEEFDQGNTSPCHDAFMLPENNFNAQQDNLVPHRDIELNVPHHLPENALVTHSASLVYADGHQERYLTVLNTPTDNYVAQTINDGHEFAVGGDASHILASLDREFGYHPQQRWHIIAIPEDNLQLLGTSRRSYPTANSGMIGGSFLIADERINGQRNITFADRLTTNRPTNHLTQGYGIQNNNCRADPGFNRFGPTQQDDLDDGLMGAGPVDPTGHGLSDPDFPVFGQPQQDNNFNHFNHMINREPNEHSTHPSNNQSSDVQPNYHSNQVFWAPLQTTPAQDDPPRPPTFSEPNRTRQSCRAATDQAKSQSREKDKKQKQEDAAIIEADDQFENYSGTNLCRWCGRRGHEAVQCIKWDPEYFDKLVCVACNNRKHSIDECLYFDAMSAEERVKLLLVDGANRPGVRSFFWPWTSIVDNMNNFPSLNSLSHTVSAVPMTRAFIKRLASAEPGGKMWTNLWKTFPYGDCQVPEEFHDGELVLEDQDECFDANWPLISRDP